MLEMPAEGQTKSFCDDGDKSIVNRHGGTAPAQPAKKRPGLFPVVSNDLDIRQNGKKFDEGRGSGRFRVLWSGSERTGR